MKNASFNSLRIRKNSMMSQDSHPPCSAIEWQTVNISLPLSGRADEELDENFGGAEVPVGILSDKCERDTSRSDKRGMNSAPRGQVFQHAFSVGRLVLLGCFLAAFSSGCRTAQMGAKPVGPTPVNFAQTELAEAELLDVGIEVFDPGPLTGKEAEEASALGSTPKIRKAESHFMPYHLKNTMQKTGHWGAVRVTPVATDSVDVSVKGMILESNGERLLLLITARDAIGDLWFQRKYYAEAPISSFTGTEQGDKDAYQNMYNRIANDLAAYKRRIPIAQKERIRTVSEMRFAQSLAPGAFKDHLSKNASGRWTIQRLPAEGDMMLERSRKIREREYMFVDTVNEYYSDYYNEMWEPYERWREANAQEAEALREVKRKARTRKILGAAAIVGAIAVEVTGNGKNTGTLRDVMVLGGMEAIKSGIGVGREAALHKAALQELSDSFSAEMTPQVVEVEGRTTKLHGSAKQQYEQFQGILKKLYAEELGFDPDAPIMDDNSFQAPVLPPPTPPPLIPPSPTLPSPGEPLSPPSPPPPPPPQFGEPPPPLPPPSGEPPPAFGEPFPPGPPPAFVPPPQGDLPPPGQPLPLPQRDRP